MSQSRISEIVNSLLSGVHQISKSETIVGAPQKAGDATVIPVHRLKIAFGAASANAGGQGGKVGGSSGGQGAGGAVELEPVAAIAVGKDGHAHLLTVEGSPETAWSSLLSQVPDLISRLAQAVGDRAQRELSARAAGETETLAADEAKKALPAREK
jgi:uncharacterized spore protein YtfJ